MTSLTVPLYLMVNVSLPEPPKKLPVMVMVFLSELVVEVHPDQPCLSRML